MRSGPLQSANKPDAVYPAIAPWFEVGCNWRAVTDPERSASQE